MSSARLLGGGKGSNWKPLIAWGVVLGGIALLGRAIWKQTGKDPTSQGPLT